MKPNELISVDWPIIRQLYVTSYGRVHAGVFYRERGAGSELGEGAPMLQLVAERKARPRGRPTKGADWTSVNTAYALDAQGQWWSVRWDKAQAVARTISTAPYAKLGRRRVGWVPTLKAQAREALRKATIKYICGESTETHAE